MKRRLKGIMERVLASPPARQVASRVHRRECLILAYHNMTPGKVQGGDRSLHLPFDQFRWQLDELAALKVISLQQALGLPGEQPPSVVLTFDDAYAGAVSLALPEILARGYPVTVFVAPGILGQPAMWWDLLAEPAGGVPAALRQRCLDELAGDHELIMATASRTGWPIGQPRDEFRIATEAELAAVSNHEGVSLGTHSWSHRNLGTSAGSVLEDELKRPLEWLRERWPRRAIPQLAFPYGIPASNPGMVNSCGLGPGLLASGGWLTRATGLSHPLPRLTVPSGLSLEGFRARIRGLWRCR